MWRICYDCLQPAETKIECLSYKDGSSQRSFTNGSIEKTNWSWNSTPGATGASGAWKMYHYTATLSKMHNCSHLQSHTITSIHRKHRGDHAQLKSWTISHLENSAINHQTEMKLLQEWKIAKKKLLLIETKSANKNILPDQKPKKNRMGMQKWMPKIGTKE